MRPCLKGNKVNAAKDKQVSLIRADLCEASGASRGRGERVRVHWEATAERTVLTLRIGREQTDGGTKVLRTERCFQDRTCCFCHVTGKEGFIKFVRQFHLVGKLLKT